MLQANQAWIALFGRIPVNLHEALVLGLTTGQEIVMQKMVRLEPDFMIIRGRVSGTQDAGRVIMIPYEQLTYVALTQLLKDPEIEAIFGKAAAPVIVNLPAPAVADNGAAAQAPPVAAPIEETPAAAVPTEESVPKRPEQPSKTALLAKLRERLKEVK